MKKNNLNCPHCVREQPKQKSKIRKHSYIVKYSRYYRQSDRKWIQRYFCRNCKKTFSSATRSLCYQQKLRHINFQVARELRSGKSMNRCALDMGINPKTVARKLEFMAMYLGLKNKENLKKLKPVEIVYFDEMETHEHSKCKPISIALAVTHSRLILDFQTAIMPSRGLLARISREKYGPRPDNRAEAIEFLLGNIKPILKPNGKLWSDMNPRYPQPIKRIFPEVEHKTVKGRRGCVVGQGELKKIGFDPLFSLNHTCAQLRDDLKRLARRTWCTTKKMSRLAQNIQIAVYFHNLKILTQL